MATDIAKAYVQIIPSAEGISGGIEKVLGGEAQKAGVSSGKSFSSSFGSAIGTGLKVAGGAAVTAAAGMAALGKSIVSNAKDTAAYGDNVDKLSQKIGISAEAFQEWDYVFSQNGADIGILETGMKKLSTTFSDAASGSDAAIEKFNALGLSLEDLSGMSQEDMFGAVISALQEMPESAERTAIASDLLGRSAMELGPLLNQTAEDTAALKDQAHDLGMIMSDEDVKSAAAFTDSMDNLSRAFAGAKNSITAELLPGLTEITNGMANLVAGNEGATEQLTNGFSMLGQSISAAIPSVVSAVSSLVQAIASVAPQMVSTLGTAILDALPTLAASLGDLIPQIVQTIMQMLPQLAQVGLQIITELANSIADALPTLIPMAVQIITQLIQTLIQNIPMLIDAAVQLITGLQQGILQAIPVLIQSIPQIITDLVNALVEGIPLLIDGAIQLVLGIVEALPDIIQALIAALPQIITAIVSALPTLIPALIQGAIQLVVALVQNLPQIIMALIQAIPQIIMAILDAFGPIVEGLGELFSQAWEGIKNVFSDVGGFFADRWNEAKEGASVAWEAIKEQASTSWEATKSVWSEVGSFFADRWNETTTGAQTMWSNVKSVFSVVGNFFKTQFTNAFNNVKNVWNKIGDFFSGIWDSIKNVFADAGAKFMEIGKNIVEGIKNGIAGTWDAFKTWLSNIFGDIVALAKKILGIASPSKVMAKEVGRWIPAGIAEGIQDNMGVLNNEIKKMSDEAVLGTIQEANEIVNSVNFVPDTSSIETGNSVVINNNIQVDGATDPEAWTQTFISTLKREARMA